MIRTDEQDELFTRYLLGDLTEQERARLEEAYFADDDVFERFLVVKGELLDAYARGGLAGRERELFERHFLSTRPRRQRLSEATELIEFSTKAAARTTTNVRERGPSTWAFIPSSFMHMRPRTLGFALAAVLAVAALGGLWAFFKSPQPRMAERAADTTPETDTATAPEIVSERQTDSASLPNKDGAAAEADRTPTVAPPPASHAPASDAHARRRPAPSSRVASVLLTPLLTRDAARANTLTLRPGTSAARLRLAFKGGDYRRYSVVLQTVEGVRVWQGAASKAGTDGAGEIVAVNVPAKVLRRKDYVIALSGVTAVGESKEINEYFLTVRKD